MGILARTPEVSNPEIEKAAQGTALLEQWDGLGLLGTGLLRVDDGLFAFDVGFAALFMLGFVVLLSHMILYFGRWLRFRVGNMNFYAPRFNLYLLFLLALVASTGCKTNKPDKQVASLRIYIENHAEITGRGQTVSVVRSQPVLVPISSDPVLAENNIAAARLIETPGGYAIEVKFNETGTLVLEQYTSANSGRHFAIFSQWGEKAVEARWLAAPIISHRISDGLYSFTPDASRDETQKIVTGLNNMAAQLAKGKLK